MAKQNKPESNAQDSGSTQQQSGDSVAAGQGANDQASPAAGASESAAPAPGGADPESAAASELPAPVAEWPKRIAIVNNTSMPLSFPGLGASVPPFGGTAMATVNTPDEATRLTTDLAQLAELHRWPEDAVEITLL